MSSIAAREIERLDGATGDVPSDYVIIRIRVKCDPGSSELVLSRIKEVMRAVIAGAAEQDWSDLNRWRALLPDWFIQACAEERTVAETERWIQWWRELPEEEQAVVEAEEPWELSNWLHWFQPGLDERQWSWWKGEIESDTELSIALLAEGWPTAHGDFNWIVRAAGATPLVED